MSRKQAKAMARKPLARFGVPIHTVIGELVLGTPSGPKKVFCWFATEDPEEDLSAERVLATKELHGPFETRAEAEKDAKIAIVGENCEIVQGGMWDPAWNRRQ
jgi:hypothetical protein